MLEEPDMMMSGDRCCKYKLFILRREGFEIFLAVDE